MNAWSNPDTLAPEAAAQLAASLHARTHTPDQIAIHAALVAALDPQPGTRGVDVGCGTGVITQRLVERVGMTGIVFGVDISDAMIQFARATFVHPALQFVQGDACALAYPDDFFDHAVVARVLMHAGAPERVLHELRRVVRPGGQLALLERDWGTVALDHSDRALTRRIIDWRTDQIDGNNWMGRQLVHCCVETHWHVRDVQPFVSIAREEQTTLVGSLRRAARLAVEHGVITGDEQTRWIQEIDQRLADGAFFASINEYIVIAENIQTE